MRLLRQAVFTYRALLSWVTPAMYFWVRVFEPIAQLSFFAILGATLGTGAEYYVVGNAVRAAAIAGLFGCSSVIVNERRSGTLQSLIMSPIRSSLALASRSLLQGLDGLVSVALAFVFGWAIFGLDFSSTHWVALIIALAVSSYSVAGLGVLVGGMGLLTADINVILNVLYGGLILLTGVNVPISELPAIVQVVSQMLPLTHGVEATRLAIGGTTEGVMFLVAIEVCVGLSYLIAGVALFQWIERLSRHRGTLERV